MGKDPLERFMRFLSTDLSLSMQYTNHSIRGTVISTLDNAGFEARHIMKLSSHKKESTIKEYSTECPEGKRKEMFECLSNAMLPTPKKQKSKPTSTVTSDENSVPQDVHDVANKLPTFDLEPIDDFDTIDDTTLANLIYDIPQTTENVDQQIDKKINTMPLQVVPQNLQTAQQLPQPPTQNIQSHFSVNNQKYPILPQMYFPNSNVTINYNFGNK